MRIVFLLALVVVSAGCRPDAGSQPAAGAQNAVGPDNQRIENRGANKDAWWQALPRPEWAAYERLPVAGDWFEVYAVADGVYAIYEPGQFEEVISFLITGTDRALLFDTGLGIGDIRAVVDALTDLEVMVLNSHTHYDHVGGNHAFDTVLGRDTDYTARHAAGRTAAELAEFISAGWVWKPLPEGFDPDAYRGRPFTVNRFVREGDQIDLGGRTLEVLLTPGHTPDAVCLIDRENRLLFTGDTFYLAPLYTHLAGSDFDRYAETAARLAAMQDEVDQLMTAHNVPVVSNRYLGRLGAAFAAIAAGSGDYVVTDGNREYDFGEFSVIVRHQDVH